MLRIRLTLNSQTEKENFTMLIKNGLILSPDTGLQTARRSADYGRDHH